MSSNIKCTFYDKKYTAKPQGYEIGSVQNNLKPCTLTLEELAENLADGCTFKTAVLNGRGADSWVEQQLFALDFDHDVTIEKKYRDAIGLGLNPVFMYTSFSHTEEEHKFRMVFCSDEVITDGDLRDKLQATLMGVIGGADKVCFNRDRLFFGGKGHKVLYPSYESRINARKVIETYWSDAYIQYISGKKAREPKKKAEKTKKAQTKSYSNVDAIKAHNAAYLKNSLSHEPIIFETKEEFWQYIYHDLDITELIEEENPKSFCCIFHEDIHPSANIFTTKQGIQKYRCASENLTLNMKQLIEMLGEFKSEFQAVQFIMDIYNLSIKESQWSIEQRENIDMMINNITLNKFQELCPQADKNIKYAKEIFLMMLSIARNNIYSEKFSNSNGEIVFFVSNKRLAEQLGKAYSQRSIDKIGKYIKMLVYHDLIRILDDEQVPKELLFKAIKYAGTNRRNGKHVNFYAIPSWVMQQLKNIESNGIRWKEKGYKIGGISYDMFYRTEGFDVAAALYPQYKKQKNEHGEIVDRTTTQASDERTWKISGIILTCIKGKGYCTEKEVVNILGNQYKYEVTETQIKRSLNEIMDAYGLKKVKANKALKEKFNIKSDGYPNIIMEDII